MVAFRLARPNDLEQLADLRWRLQTDDAPDFEAGKKVQFVADFSAATVNRDPNTLHFVAESESRIVGAMTVRKVEKIPAPDRLVGFWGYLTNCYVLPDFRDSGCGSGLLDFVLAWATQEKLELLVMWPSDRAYPFYERKGFTRPADPLVLNLMDA
jgi:GNAT superfamily N-acetyltransferase